MSAPNVEANSFRDNHSSDKVHMHPFIFFSCYSCSFMDIFVRTLRVCVIHTLYILSQNIRYIFFSTRIYYKIQCSLCACDDKKKYHLCILRVEKDVLLYKVISIKLLLFFTITFSILYIVELNKQTQNWEFGVPNIRILKRFFFLVLLLFVCQVVCKVENIILFPSTTLHM